MLAEQVEQGGFQRGDDVDGGAQVEGLRTASAGVAIGEGPSHIAEQILVQPDRLADNPCPGLFQRLPNGFAAGDFADAGVARIVV